MLHEYVDVTDIKDAFFLLAYALQVGVTGVTVPVARILSSNDQTPRPSLRMLSGRGCQHLFRKLRHRLQSWAPKWCTLQRAPKPAKRIPRFMNYGLEGSDPSLGPLRAQVRLLVNPRVGSPKSSDLLTLAHPHRVKSPLRPD